MNKDIIVIGAGLTGLTTAFHAKRQGKDVLVIERDDVPGGQMRSHREGEYIFESGPSTGVVSNAEVAELFEALQGDVEMDSQGQVPHTGRAMAQTRHRP